MGFELISTKGGILLPVIVYWKLSASIRFQAYCDVGNIAFRDIGFRFARDLETNVMKWLA
jgi:hypothetical protein